MVTVESAPGLQNASAGLPPSTSRLSTRASSPAGMRTRAARGRSLEDMAPASARGLGWRDALGEPGGVGVLAGKQDGVVPDVGGDGDPGDVGAGVGGDGGLGGDLAGG